MTVETRPGSRPETHDPFVLHITKVCSNNPGQRSALRRGLGRPPEQAHTMHATVARWLPGRSAGVGVDAREWALYAVASMIAVQPGRDRDQPAEEEPPTGPTTTEPAAEPDGRPPRRTNLGTALALAVTRAAPQHQAMGFATAEKRLHLLTRQDLPGVHQHLPATVRHVRTLGVRIDWAQLIHDLSSWSYQRDRVAKQWLQDFYRTYHANNEE